MVNDAWQLDGQQKPDIRLRDVHFHHRGLGIDRYYPDRTKHGGTATGEDLAKLVEGAIEQHGHKTMITAVVTNCEPAMVKVGRILSKNEVTEYIGFAGHLLQSSVEELFTGEDVKHALKYARSTIAR